MVTRIADAVSAYNRARKYTLFLEHLKPTQSDRLLDVGYADEEYSLNDNYIEKHYPYPRNITALGILDPSQFKVRYPEVVAVRYDGSRFPFDNNQFEIGWSNAVLEHVGDTIAQTRFLGELKRTCKRVFVTTPNRYFPIETHTRVPFLHWLPKAWFDRLLLLLGKSWATGNQMNLLSERDLERLLNLADVIHYRIFRNRYFLFTLDFVVIMEQE
jgi:SAM-dependent methyltransferase